MTPPDSGEMIGVCDLDGFPKSWPEHDYPHRPLPSCVNWEPVAVAQTESKPGSGEREAMGHKPWCQAVYLEPGSGVPYPCNCVEQPPQIVISQDLAQRILAALELNAMAAGTTEERALASELRAAVERES